VILAGTDNDFSVTQIAGSTTQFDVYYNPATGGRIQCDLGTFANCFSINADGTLGAAYFGSTSGFALIPGLLYAFTRAGSDFASFVSPAAAPLPATLPLLLAGLALVPPGVRRRS